MANPNPARITDQLWDFRTACLALEPGTNDQDSGIYADKPGYHNTRAQNDPDNYSVRDAPDKHGPSDKAAAWDWTFLSAQSGDYSRISIYGKRMLTAWNAEDPRCNVLREFLGQTDTDSTPEGLDFRYHTKRTPDDSHRWHIHWSFVRAYVANAGAFACVLSVLKGETLDAYLARGGELYKIDGTGEIEGTMDWNDKVPAGATDNNNRTYGQCLTDVENVRNWGIGAEGSTPGPGSPSATSRTGLLHSRVQKLEGWAADTTTKLNGMADQLDRIEAAVLALGTGVPPADLTAIEEQLGLIKDDVGKLKDAALDAAEATTTALTD